MKPESGSLRRKKPAGKPQGPFALLCRDDYVASRFRWRPSEKKVRLPAQHEYKLQHYYFRARMYFTNALIWSSVSLPA